MNTNNASNIKNPWLGLKSYSEGLTLYGRDKEIEDLSQKILYNTQTVIYGKSGIGKSSLLKAGVCPILRRHNYFPVYVRFVHEEGQISYAQQIFSAIEESLRRLKVEDLSASNDEIYKIEPGYKEEVVPAYDSSQEETMWEYFHRHRFYYQSSDDSAQEIMPVLIFDQFEEIFTLQKNVDLVNDFFDELANLLNNVCPNYLLAPTIEENISATVSTKNSLIKRGVVHTNYRRDYIDETNLHIVISLREDYLSYLERNITHIPSLKHNRYCLLPLSEDQAAEVIMQPLPGMISETVAKEIISKVTGVPFVDFEIDDKPTIEVNSAILSLFMSELYEKKPIESKTIDQSLIAEFGDNIIQGFYERTISHISEDCAEYLENKLITKDGKRDSIYKSYVINEKKFKESDIEFLKEKRILREFPWNDGTRIEFIHDILCPIIVKRREERRIEQEKIEAERLREEERKKQEEALSKLKKDKQRYMIACFLVIVSLGLSVLFIWDGWFQVKTKRYRRIVKVNTWMVGAGKLTKKEASYLPYHYVIYKTGRYANYPDSIEARDGYGSLTTNHTMSTYLVNHMDDTDNKADAEMLQKLASVVKWILVPDDKRKYCLQEMAYGDNGNLVYTYANTMIHQDSLFISTYVNEYGFPIIMRDSCNIYLRTTLDEHGHEILQEFFDTKGFPTQNKDDAFQTERAYFANGVQQSEASLFLNGYRMNDRFGNCGWEILELDDNGINGIWLVHFDRHGELCETISGVMFTQLIYDEYGRCESEIYWKSDQDYDIEDVKFLFKIDARYLLDLIPDVDKYGVHKTIYNYNRYGQCTYICYLDTANNITMPTNQDFAEIYDAYDDKGNLCRVTKKDSKGKVCWESLREYNDDHKLIYCLEYNINQYGDTLLDDHLYYDQKTNCKITKSYYHDNNYYTLQEYDKDENLLSVVWYTIDSNKPDGDGYGRYKKSLTYDLDRDRKRTTITSLYYDTLDRYCAVGDYFKEIEVIDSLARTKSNQRYSTDSIRAVGYEYNIEPEEVYYVNGAEKIYDYNFEVQLGEYSIDMLGERHRTYENNAYYYKTIYIRSVLSHQYNDVNDMYMVNEFGEPSLVRWSGELFSAQYKGVKYDEFGQEITEELERPLFAAIENGQDLGFCDGDILLQQDDWILWLNSSYGFSFMGLDLEPQANTEHTFKVLRFNEQIKDYEIVEIIIPKGEERITRVEYKKLYVTKKEYDRVRRTLRKNNIYPQMFEFVPKEGGILWNEGMTSPALLVSFNDWDMTRQFSGDMDSVWSMIKNNEGKTKYITVYDETLDAMQTYVIGSDTLDIQIESYTVRPSYYDEILEKMYIHKQDTLK